MKRDLDYLRGFLMQIENEPRWVFVDPLHMNMSEAEHKHHYHIKLAIDAGLLTPVGRGTFRMTSAGHDYLDAIRDERIWTRTKEIVSEQGGSAAIELVKQIAVGFLKKQIADRTGISI